MSKEDIVSLSLQVLSLIAGGVMIVYSIKESKRIEAYNAEVRLQNDEIRIWNSKFSKK